jgi:hypothetical protein
LHAPSDTIHLRIVVHQPVLMRIWRVLNATATPPVTEPTERLYNDSLRVFTLTMMKPKIKLMLPLFSPMQVFFMGSDAGAEQTVPPSSTGSGLVDHSGFMDGLKKSANDLKQKATALAKQGLEKGRQLAADPRTKQVEGEALASGNQIIQEHKQEGIRTWDAGKRGDFKGVLANGVPLAAEAAMHANPIGLAITLVKPKVLDIAISQLPAEQRSTLTNARNLADGASGITHFNIHGIGGAQQLLQRAAEANVQQQVPNVRGTGRIPTPEPTTFAAFDQQTVARAGAGFDEFLKRQAKKTIVDNSVPQPPPNVPKSKN